jgi:mono/diheme cytochrome c family protein
MLSFSPLLAAPSGPHELGLALVGGAFILFALVSSFVLPRRDPDYPGRGLKTYIGVTVLFFVAMLASVVLFGKEQKSEASPETRVTTSPAPQITTNAAPQTTPSGTNGTSAAQGNATAGKAVFASAGCATCHTLKAAGSTGNIGPNLDQLKPDDATVEHQVENGGGAMPAFKGQLSQQQIADVSAFVSQNAGK